MFEHYSNLIKKDIYEHISIDSIFNNQEAVFCSLFGYYPELNKRYKSPFRVDKDAGCRFRYHNGILYFIDNAKYQNKLSFNCIDACMSLYKLSFREALKKIAKDNYLPVQNLYESERDNKDYSTKIRFTYTEWSDNNYYSKYRIDKDYLNLQPYYNVLDYWTNTKSDINLVKNRFTNPRIDSVIAYFFSKTKQTKLYFPQQEFRFYSNASEDNIFGWHRMGDYLFNRENKEIVICSSAKDELCLNYYTNTNTLALQSETQVYFSEEFYRTIKYFNPIYIWLDNDRTGIASTKRLVEHFKLIYPTKKIIGIYQNIENDIADIVEYHKDELNHLFYEILK